MRMEINKADWSGETIKISVNLEKREFSLYGYRFKLVLKDESKCAPWTWTTYNIMGDNWEHPLGVVVQEDDEVKQTQTIEAWHGKISESNLSRTGSNIYEAAVKMLCNVI
jgi:hypothetical protein